jgi:hypothetical protein
MSSDLLAIKERISNNLSSKQIITILNELLYAAAEPLFYHSSLMRELILQATLQTQRDHRRKISVHSKEITTGLILYGVMNHDFNSIKLCGMDRGLIFKAATIVYDYLYQAIKLEQQLLTKPRSRKLRLQMEDIAFRTGINTNLLTPLYRWVHTYYQMYRTFKEQITEKYIRFARSEANRAQANTQLFVDTHDLFKNYLLAVDRAIDKCDADSGTLTHYIQQWMLSARSSPEFDHQYSTSFTVPANVRKDREREGRVIGNLATSIDEKHYEIPDEDADDRLQRVMAHDKILLTCLRDIKGCRLPFILLSLPIMLRTNEVNNLRGGLR